MDPNSLSKKWTIKIKAFWELWGAKRHDGPLPGLWVGPWPGCLPPGSASGYHYILLVLDLTWSGDLAFGDRESKNPHNVFRDILVGYLNHVVLRPPFFSHLLGKTSYGKKLPSSGASFPTFPAYWSQIFTNQTETKPSANVGRATLNRHDFGNGNFVLANNPNVTLRSMNGGRDITKSCQNAGRPWQR